MTFSKAWPELRLVFTIAESSFPQAKQDRNASMSNFIFRKIMIEINKIAAYAYNIIKW